MAEKNQLAENEQQIRDWAGEGRTDAWIAHQLSVTGADLLTFKRQVGLAEPLPEEEVQRSDQQQPVVAGNEVEPELSSVAVISEPTPPSQRYEGTFDHGKGGYGVWLDPTLQDSAIYRQYWADQRAVQVEISPDEIVIRR